MKLDSSLALLPESELGQAIILVVDHRDLRY